MRRIPQCCAVLLLLVAAVVHCAASVNPEDLELDPIVLDLSPQQQPESQRQTNRGEPTVASSALLGQDEPASTTRLIAKGGSIFIQPHTYGGFGISDVAVSSLPSSYLASLQKLSNPPPISRAHQVPGQGFVIEKVIVHLHGLKHNRLDKLAILLEGPNKELSTLSVGCGQGCSSAEGSAPTPQDLIFDDRSDQILSLECAARRKWQSKGGDALRVKTAACAWIQSFAPFIYVDSYAGLGVFNHKTPQGTWKLWILDQSVKSVEQQQREQEWEGKEGGYEFNKKKDSEPEVKVLESWTLEILLGMKGGASAGSASEEQGESQREREGVVERAVNCFPDPCPNATQVTTPQTTTPSPATTTTTTTTGPTTTTQPPPTTTTTGGSGGVNLVVTTPTTGASTTTSSTTQPQRVILASLNPTQPVLTMEVQGLNTIGYSVRFTNIRELTSNGGLVKTVVFPTTGFTLYQDISSTGLYYFYVLDILGAQIILTYRGYTQATPVTFAGLTFETYENSVLLQISILNWAFETSSAFLQVEFAVEPNQGTFDGSSVTDSTINTNLTEVRLHHPDSWNAQCAMADFVLLENLSVRSPVTYAFAGNIVRVNFERFQNNLYWDPNFGLLVETNNGDGGDGGGTDGWIIGVSVALPVAACFGVFFIIAAIVVVTLVIKKYKSHRYMSDVGVTSKSDSSGSDEMVNFDSDDGESSDV